MWRRLVDVARKRRAFWESVPPRGHALVLAAAFAVFAGIGFLTDILSIGRNPLPIVFLIAGLSGTVAVAWALTMIRSAKFLPLAVGLYLLMFWVAGHYESQGFSLDPAGFAALAVRGKIDATAVIVAVSAGYALFIVFIAVEGRRYMRAHTEVALAQEIHRHLVPSVDRTVGRFEFFGRSLPSSEVGGDLVDVVELGERCVAYVADVSGHGVASGALMGMFKSAVRTRLTPEASLDAVLDDVNRVLIALRRPGMFVTCAFLSTEDDRSSRLRFAVAGHPPILHWRHTSGAVEELTTPQPPIAMLEDEPSFRSADVCVERGDLLALVSDGLMEVFDRRDHEYGIAALKQALAAGATRPLHDLFDAMVADVRAHGPQLDDQSLLLVRVLS
jgi:serine phosphatase RsbU (regulator of sigma subunit)